MSSFLILGTYDHSAVAPLLANADQQAVLKKIAAKSDVEVTYKQAWFTSGMYDLVVEIDAPTTGQALAYALALNAITGMKTYTLAAEPDLAAVVKRAADAHTKHGDAYTKHGKAKR